MTSELDPFIGEDEISRLARSLDWASTSLGPVETWSPALRSAVRTCLVSPFPMNLWCGPELVLIYNEGYRSVLGSKHPEALGRPGPEVWSEIWGQIEPMFQQIREGGPSVFAEDAAFLVARTGQEGEDPAEPNAWFTFSLSPVLDEGGRIVAFLNIVAETTPRILAEQAQELARAKAEQAERRLQDVFAQAPAFMAVLRGPEHTFEYVNQAYYQLVGHRHLVGRPVLEALPEVRDQGFDTLLDGVLETGKPYVGREVAIRLSRTPESEPEERFVDFVYYPITESDGRRTGIVAHGSDVTDHVRARREAQRARAEAERANTAKSQFLTTMSHEIRTPINAVIGYTDLLDAGLGGPLSDQQQGYVESIRASSRHLLGLVSDVLDLARIEAGEMPVSLREMPVREPVRSALQLVAPQGRRKDIGLEEHWDCDESTAVLGDEDRIRQILLNLLSNAIKFTDAGGRVAVRCRSSDGAPAEAALPELGPWVVVEVEDTGTGIAENQRARVFEPFVQADEGHTRRAGGTGLGLTISRRMARLMGGELTLQSEEGKGSTFSLWLAPATQKRRAATGSLATEVGTWPPGLEERIGLASAGRTILSCIEAIEDAWAERLRTDPGIATAASVNRAQALDQTAELVAAMAKVLFVLEEGGGDPTLLEDAEAIKRTVARRHGHQRRRLGWGRGELVREYELLGEVLDATLRREAPKRTAADLGTALGVVRRLVRRAAEGSLTIYDTDP